jgi:uncharacterized protein with GYD domain
MRYVLLGTLNPEWATRQTDRIGKVRGKLEKLGINLESMHYTQGPFDFVDLVDAPSPEAMLAFSVWYAAQGMGRIQSLPAFDASSFEAAAREAASS